MCKHCKDSHLEKEDDFVVSFTIEHPESKDKVTIERNRSQMEEFAIKTALKAFEEDEVAQTGVALLYYLEDSANRKSKELIVVESRIECMIDTLRDLKDSAKSAEEFQTAIEDILKADEAASGLLSMLSSLDAD